MHELTLQIANRIKTFRRRQNMSIAELARRISKSTATVYKYESGQIPVTVDVLEDIAAALGVDPVYFFDFPSGWGSRPPKVSFLENGQLYAYYYDGRIHQLSKSLLTFGSNGEGNAHAMFYMHLKSFEKPENARYLYAGRMLSHEMVSYFFLENVTLPTETLTLQVMHPFRNSLTSWGLFMGLSDQPLTPMATKMLFSSRLLTLHEIEQFPLAFTRDELKRIRLQNALLLSIQQKEDNE